MIETIIILSIILVIVLAYLIYQQVRMPQIIKKSNDKACGELFAMMLAGGYEKRVNDFKIYNQTASKGGIVFVGDSLTENYNVYESFKGYDVYNGQGSG